MTGDLAGPSDLPGPSGRVDLLDPLVRRVIGGDRRALARLISLFEDRSVTLGQPPARPGLVVGITGPPGAGKSTLVSALVTHVRGQARRVGVLAVDPSSPRTGGALLGDRVRMAAHVGDPEVFIRGLASRGRTGGLADVVPDATIALELWGADVVFVETVGVGQTAVEVVRAVDVTVLVLTAGSGDEIQAAKAGVLEVADVIVVNKADQPGASALMSSMRAMLRLHRATAPAILSTCAADGTGVPALWSQVDRAPSAEAVAGRRRTAATHRLAVAVGDHVARLVNGGRVSASGLVEAYIEGRAPLPAVLSWIADHLEVTCDAVPRSVSDTSA